MVKVKICGITNTEDAIAAISAGADALGFVFFRESPRYISPENAKSVINALPPFIIKTGVFVNESSENIEKIISITGVDLVQLHGEEPPAMCRSSRHIIKAFRVKSMESLDPLNDYKELVSAFLLDTYAPDILGGTGQIFNWDIAVEAKNCGRIILAGGLTPDNVSEAVRRVGPYAVDVSSGIESKKGKKDHQKMRLFIERAKSVLP
jgi:phosphoribosylanthranilate isomerase